MTLRKLVEVHVECWHSMGGSNDLCKKAQLSLATIDVGRPQPKGFPRALSTGP